MRRMTSPASTMSGKKLYKHMRFSSGIFGACLAGMMLLLTSCDPDMVYENNKLVSSDGWKAGELMKFNVELNDTLTPHHFYLNIRTTADYKYANLFLFLRTLYPSGKVSSDTLECFLADVDGRWLGKRSGSKIDNRILFRKNLRFGESGMYSFEFEQGMRDSLLKEVSDFGIRIEKANP
jgi:gliding motility-associated lipoprotein GldH